MNDAASVHKALGWKRGGIAAIAVLVLAGAAALFGYFGAYNVAADVPHTKLVYWFLDGARQHSVAVRARGIRVTKDLKNPALITQGAGLYAEMCTGCHLAPGMEPTEISQGLYPRAPVLAQGTDLTAAEEFWIIKHGVKMTGMAAWGRTHSDVLIWDMVAFLQKLPSLSPEQYRTLVKIAPEDHDEIMKSQDHAH